ncbi:hypothetical protein HaLaN_09457 [Haematococcus lacustris]|uniref:Uncharacterized protein n=1 Tax=Haematococcus lacustris TaxID=44745 RepID=A0A699ZDI1_HAELA|nr:hypothetical protein HaLaN_09457 [Haematococcus lacustris]
MKPASVGNSSNVTHHHCQLRKRLLHYRNRVPAGVPEQAEEPQGCPTGPVPSSAAATGAEGRWAATFTQVVVLNVEASTSMGLQAFAQALPQVRETRELLLSLLACEFVSLAHFSQASQVMDAAIAQAVAGATGAGTPVHQVLVGQQ